MGSDSLWPHRLNSLGQNTGVGSLSLLQGIFPTRGWKPGFLHCRGILYHLNHKGSPTMLEWVAYPFSGRSSCPRIQPGVSCIAGRFFTNWAIRDFKKERTLRINCVCKITKQIEELRFKFRPFLKENRSVMTLCDPMDYTIHEILQARILEWVAFPFSRGSSQPSDGIQVSHIAGRFFTNWATREAQEYWHE